MSKSFLDNLPEAYRKHYEKIVINPKAATVQFDTLVNAEKIKENTREKSALYKIIGENLFGITTMDGRLHLDIDLFDMDSVMDKLAKESNLLAYIRRVQMGLTAGVYIPGPDLPEVQWKSLSFETDKLLDELAQDIEDITAALFKVECLFVEKTNKAVYLDRDGRDSLRGITKMIQAISSRSLTFQQVQYMRMVVKPKKLDAAMRNIRWTYELQ